MCCFSAPVEEVKQTRILVLPTKDGRQVTVYENHVGVTGDVEDEDDKKKKDAILAANEKAKYENAMILPCPLKAGAKVQLLDLSKDNFSFERLESYFPQYVFDSEGDDDEGDGGEDHGALEIFEVGAYFVSIAEKLEDLKRIDPKVFKVSANLDLVFQQHYKSGYGFVVCCFNQNKKIEGHPIAYVHDLMSDGKMFVPCRHEHGHGTKEKEAFDHFIYSVNTKGDEASGMSKADLLKEAQYQMVQKALSENEALASSAMGRFYPQVKMIRRRRIMGKYKNDDLIFTIA